MPGKIDLLMRLHYHSRARNTSRDENSDGILLERRQLKRRVETVAAELAILQLERKVDALRQRESEFSSTDAADKRFPPGNDVYAGVILIGRPLPAEARLQFQFRQDFELIMPGQTDIAVFGFEKKGIWKSYVPFKAASFDCQIAGRANKLDGAPNASQAPHHNSSR